MTLRHSIQILGPALTLIGLVYSIVGTYFLTRLYHAYRIGAFCAAVLHAVWNISTFRPAEVFRLAKVTTMTGSVTAEDKARSLVGIYLIFFGFFLQFVGAVMWGVDVSWAAFFEHSAP